MRAQLCTTPLAFRRTAQVPGRAHRGVQWASRVQSALCAEHVRRGCGTNNQRRSVFHPYRHCASGVFYFTRACVHPCPVRLRARQQRPQRWLLWRRALVLDPRVTPGVKQLVCSTIVACVRPSLSGALPGRCWRRAARLSATSRTRCRGAWRTSRQCGASNSPRSRDLSTASGRCSQCASMELQKPGWHGAEMRGLQVKD